MQNITTLKKRYPQFVYRGYSYEIKKGDLHISFDFRVPARNALPGEAGGGEIKFRPKVTIKNIPQGLLNQVKQPVIENLVFHLGLAEMPSYWKTTASPKIVIEAGALTKAQINWWHDLFMQGMGQYFYENKINFTNKSFLEIESTGKSRGAVLTRKLSKRTLVPIGGGKDAVVTLELLKKTEQELRGFVLNPKREQEGILKIAGMENPIIVRRYIDPKLLELNRKTYLNGHTPFSAYLAFLTVLCGILFDYKYIALSNERSSNEGNVKYLDRVINHQYSKSFAFEKKFRVYSKKYLAKDIEYFSFLRPLYELQIAKLFSKYPKYCATFLSCNESHKTQSETTQPSNIWCAACSKCLFIFASLYPFVQTKELIRIFGSNLFNNKSLIPIMEELVGERKFKPFECVGTTKESLVVFYLSLQTRNENLPVVLEHFRNKILPKHKNTAASAKRMLASWDTNNFVPAQLEKLLKMS